MRVFQTYQLIWPKCIQMILRGLLILGWINAQTNEFKNTQKH